MIALLLTLQAGVADQSPASAAEDVVVYGARLSKFRASPSFDHGEWQCRIQASTDDDEIDEVGCHAIIGCYPAYRARDAAAHDVGQRRAARAGLGTCFAATTKAGLADLAARRTAQTGR